MAEPHRPVWSLLAVRPDHSKCLSMLIIVGRNHPTLPCGKVLRSVEAENSHVGDAPNPFTIIPLLLARSDAAFRSEGNPKRSVGIIAFVFRVTTSSILSVLRQKVSLSISAKTGVAPARTIALTAPTNVKEGTTTSSPGPTSAASKAA